MSSILLKIEEFLHTFIHIAVYIYKKAYNLLMVINNLRRCTSFYTSLKMSVQKDLRICTPMGQSYINQTLSVKRFAHVSCTKVTFLAHT